MEKNKGGKVKQALVAIGTIEGRVAGVAMNQRKKLLDRLKCGVMLRSMLVYVSGLAGRVDGENPEIDGDLAQKACL